MPFLVWIVLSVCTNFTDKNKTWMNAEAFNTSEEAQAEIDRKTKGDTVTINCQYGVYQATKEETKNEQ